VNELRKYKNVIDFGVIPKRVARRRYEAGRINSPVGNNNKRVSDWNADRIIRWANEPRERRLRVQMVAPPKATRMRRMEIAERVADENVRATRESESFMVVQFLISTHSVA
jgi:hypothetical protein